jgi:hypothetical protein
MYHRALKRILPFYKSVQLKKVESSHSDNGITRKGKPGIVGYTYEVTDIENRNCADLQLKTVN